MTVTALAARTEATDAIAWSRAVRDAAPTSDLTRLLESRDPRSLSDVELVDALTAHRRLANVHSAAQLELADELMRRREAEEAAEVAEAAEAAETQNADVGAPGLSRRRRAEVAARVGMELRVAWAQTRFHAEQRLRLARRLSEDLPGTSRLLKDGRIDEYTARIIADELGTIQPRELVRVAEEVLLDRLDAGEAAGGALLPTDTTKVRRLARLTAAQADPATFDERFRRAHAEREVVRYDEGDGMARLALTHSSIEVEAVHQRLTRLATALGTDDPRSMDQRRADLAVDLLLGRGDADHLGTDVFPGSRSRVQTRIVVTVPVQSLMGVSDDPGIRPGGDPVPASLARMIAADPASTWYRMLTDPAGRMLDLSTRSYRHAAPLARAVDARDQVSVAPGSSTPSPLCDHDHTVPWPAGPTSYANSGLLSRSDHRVRHSPGFDLTQPEPGVFTWTTPTGHTWVRRPPPQPVGRWPQQWREPRSAHEMQQALAALDRERTRVLRSQVADARRRVAEARLHAWEREDVAAAR